MTRDDYYNELLEYETEVERELDHLQELREEGIVVVDDCWGDFFGDDSEDDISDNPDACTHEDS